MTRRRRGGGESAFQMFTRQANEGRKLREKSERNRDSGGNHRGGFGEPAHGFVDDKPVTVAFGWGTKEGHTLLADGHVDLSTFKQHENHNHYGPGNGPHGNVKDRLRYSGPGH